MMQTETLKVWDAAKIIGIGRLTAYQMIRRGELPHIKCGPKLILVPRKALDRWLEERTTKGEAA